MVSIVLVIVGTRHTKGVDKDVYIGYNDSRTAGKVTTTEVTLN